MEIRILGPLEVVGDAGPIGFRSPRLRRLLGALVAGRRGPVSTDALVDAVWGPTAPPGASSTLHGYVHRLRSILPGAVVTTPTGYRLQDVTVDADRFAALLADASAARRHRDHGSAIELFDVALGLWRGNAYGELAEHEFVELEAMELDERWRVAVEDRADELLAAGRHGEAVGGLRAALADEPYRDRRCAQLMLALHRAGRRPEALGAFSTHRQRLVDELGVEPSADLCSLAQMILQRAPALDWQPDEPGGAEGVGAGSLVVDAVACAWIPPDPELLTIVTGLAPADVLDQLDGAVRAGVLVLDARRRSHFVDPDLQQLTARRVAPGRAATLHEAYLRFWAARSPDVDALVACAVHAGAAVPLVGVDEAAGRALAAGRSCLDHGALEDSAAWFATASELGAPCTHERVEATVGRATALAWSGDPSWIDVAVEAGRLADEIGDVDGLVAAARVSPGTVATGSPARSDLIQRALALVPSGHVLRGVLEGELALERLSPVESGRECVPSDDQEHAERLVLQLNDASAFMVPATRRAIADDLEAAGHRLGSVDALWLAAAHRFWSSAQLADRAGLEHALGQVQSRRPRARRVGARAFTDHLGAIVAALDGDLETADALLAQASAARPPDQLGLGPANEAGLLLRIRRDQGRLSELVAEDGEPQAPFPRVFASASRALVLTELGDHAAAVRALRRRSLDDRCPGLYRPHLSMLIVEAAEACGAADHVERELVRLRPLAGLVMCTTRGCDGAVDRVIGLGAACQGRLDEADRWLASSLALHEQLRAPTLVARTLYDRARLLDDTAAGERCRELVDRYHLEGLRRTQ